MIGSDLDGVIAHSILNKKDYRPFRLHTYYAQSTPAPLCSVHMDYIITGRKDCFRKVTEKWLDEHDVYYGQLIMFPIGEKKNNKTLSEYKAKKIVDFGINVFYEDDERIAEFLERNCPNTEIIFVDDGN